jgi:hypothetical protein
VWHGHARDLARLVESADTYCSCGHGVAPGRNSPPCSTHQILADQHTLDHLAFARVVLHRLVQEEWRAPAVAESRADKAEWSAFLHACASAREQVPVRAYQLDRSPRAVFGAWIVSLIALVALILMLRVHAPAGARLPTVPQPVATWQTR